MEDDGPDQLEWGERDGKWKEANGMEAVAMERDQGIGLRWVEEKENG